MKISAFNKKSSGFTLIELLVVVAIISLLTSVILAALSSARSKARDVVRMSDIHQMQVALELYYNVNGAYPNTPQAADSVNCENRFPTLDTYLSPYMPVIPHDPLGPPSSPFGNRYCYYYNAVNGGKGYVIMAYQVELSSTAAKGEGAACYADTTNVYCKGVNY